MKKMMTTFSMMMTAAMMLGLQGCGDANDVNLSATKDASASETQNETSIVPGTFKLYSDVSRRINPTCDVFTRAELVNGFAGGILTLENRVGGLCEIYVAPNARLFNLTLARTECGSRVYMGKADAVIELYDPRRVVEVEVIDHRTRVCRDLVPAEIIVKETLADGSVVVRYSRD